MPRSFVEDYGYKVVAILDCFEIFVDRPSTLITKAVLWSNYKHHHTVKFPVCIAPQGVISYISSAWDGRVSDEHITQNSRFLANLIPGDVCLADRGFNIAETLAGYGATLKTPAFTVVVVVVGYLTPSEGWEHGGRTWSPRSRATPQGLDQRS